MILFWRNRWICGPLDHSMHMEISPAPIVIETIFLSWLQCSRMVTFPYGHHALLAYVLSICVVHLLAVDSPTLAKYCCYGQDQIEYWEAVQHPCVAINISYFPNCFQSLYVSDKFFKE